AEWNTHLIGDHENGKIYYVRSNKYKDDNNTMRSAWLTGYIDHGTGLKKRSLKLRLRLKRGDITDDTTPELMLRWRDDGSQVWGNSRHIDLGSIGENEQYVTLRRLGMYRSRQYELSVTDNVPIIIADAEEYVEVIPR
ncbi:MAG: hypothetical protein KGY70_18300, partial [Bacteroidales bacterium]|nr:hypothetical protein [Bacteroidales bacterium]